MYVVKKILPIFIFLIIILLVCFSSSCKKDIFLSKGHLKFSADTVLFDTVFTTIGSTTKRFKIYNTSNKPLQIEKVLLSGGKSSPYRINFDGLAGISFSNITIPAEDSLFIFVEVTLDPNGLNLPFIITDSVLFRTNGNDQYVQLAAWGEDAHFHRGEIVSGVWTNDKPHVIYNFAFVDTNTTLNIQPGVKIYMHKGAMLIVDQGTLNINGTATDKVTIQSDRREPFYKDKTGQYYGIYFNYAHTSTISYLEMKNGTAGIHITGNNGANGTDYTVKINNSSILNMASYGIFNYEGGKILGKNLNIYGNKAYAFFQLEGGSYSFNHCQFISFGADGEKPAIAIKNYFTHADDGITYLGSIDEGNIYNSIIWGGAETQIAYDTIVEPGVTINYDFNTNFIRQKTIQTGSGFTNNTWNVNPKMTDNATHKYKISASSSCKDAGNVALGNVLDDIEGNPRSDGNPDIGAYELQ